MANAFSMLKKPVIFIYAGLTLLSPLSLLMLKVPQFIGVITFAILSGVILFALIHFFEFKLNLDIDDSQNLNEENKVKFDALLNAESKTRILFVNICIMSSIIILTLSLIMKNPTILLAQFAAIVLLFLFFQNQISGENIPVLKKKFLEDNINENLGVIRKKPLEEEDGEEE